MCKTEEIIYCHVEKKLRIVPFLHRQHKRLENYNRSLDCHEVLENLKFLTILRVVGYQKSRYIFKPSTTRSCLNNPVKERNKFEDYSPTAKNYKSENFRKIFRRNYGHAKN